MTDRSSLTRVVCGAAAGALALAVLPAVATPAHAATTAITPAETVTKLRAAAASTRETSLTFGARSALSAKVDLGGAGEELRGDFVVDHVRRLTQSRVEVVGGLGADLPDLPGRPRGNPCLYGADLSSEVELDQAGVGRYEHLGSPRGPYVKKGLRVVERPAARWQLKRNRSLTMEQSVARNDLASGLIGMVTDASFTKVISATTEPIAANGTRYTVKFTDAMADDAAGDGTLVVDVHEGGPIASIALTETSSFLGLSTSSSMSATYTYAEQTLAVPAFATVIYPKQLRAGCTAALTRDTVKATAATVVKKLNKGKGQVTAGKIRKAVKRELRKTHKAAKVKRKVVEGGVRLTGRHRFIVPVVRTIVVVDGKAVVRKR